MTLVDPFRFRTSNGISLSQAQKETLVSVLDTFIAPLSEQEEDQLVKKLAHSHSEEHVRSFCRLSSSDLGLLEIVESSISRVVVKEKHAELLTILSVLSSRAGTFVLTGRFTTFKSMSREDRESAILKWKDSTLFPQFRKIYKSFQQIACFNMYSHFGHHSIIQNAMKFKVPDINQEYEDHPERLEMFKSLENYVWHCK
ncbi:hypothetical protein K501DRAFT_266169 [Backusella circina FSU 941]|nr:hypothetical protein K501DRAFT_266169 [Backusella circina FSU 941]